MRLKSYLRGIGIGIIVTSAIFIVANAGRKGTMTDAQVKARAKELGMIEAVEDSVVADVPKTEPIVEVVDEVLPSIDVAKAEDKKEEPVADDGSKKEVVTKEDEKKQDKEDVIIEEPKVEETKKEEVKKEETKVDDTKKEEPKKEEVKETKTEETPVVTDSSNTIIIVVNSGEGSDTVARKCYEAGLVSNAVEFDKFLSANGYDRKITTGNHKIPVNASQEEIAKNLVASTR